MKSFMKILAAISFMLALNGFVYADADHYGNDSMMGQEMMNTDSGMNTNCVAKYNFLTGILNVPCVDAGGEIYWINLKLKQEGNKITMELIDAGRNDNVTNQETEQMNNMDENEMGSNNRNMMNENDEMMDNQTMRNERGEMMNYNNRMSNNRRMMNYR